MNQVLNDAKKDEERWGRHSGISEPPRPWIGVGSASEREREKRHEKKRHDQDQGRGDNCERRRCCGLGADHGVKGPE
ncbi:hypothetical protein EDE08_11756 [Bradyrhizobium sp. R2.2-H]|jgi:hypothetical protein|nr:hypothetical protein EDE10_11790 [Bradyrhizobium sp. Y-H1]TCU65873.1 hypothetical protein EDE08_11756 [Bradyrhizobium sp. R2.2-H]